MARPQYERDWVLRFQAACEREMENPTKYSIAETDHLIEELELARSCRYISRSPTYNTTRRSIIERLEGFNDTKCKAILRMSQSSFMKLLLKVFDHDEFKNISYNEQEEVACQLAVTLDRLGHYAWAITGTVHQEPATNLSGGS
ncbi:hypothetical protein BGZ99_005715 [Dissophora globulifera]|uniref:Uncharacterized protein n=1 Tax=Dissophora globulifera TaxID=979702 RepID=A0A9P6RFD4_9FUNG|nr:hypothetical protein BGZ99_005715 [Dissophora globulifera]